MLERSIVLSEIQKHSGKILPASFFREKRSNPLVEEKYEYHNLIRGIYKPKGSDLALSILQVAGGRYADSLEQHGNIWRLRYMEQGQGKQGWDNLSLQRCIGSPPVGVIIQATDKTSQHGSSYRILGLGEVESYKESEGTFAISQWKGELGPTPVNATEPDIRKQALQMEAEMRKPFQPFEDRQTTDVKRIARAEAFRRTVLKLYDERCAVCENHWVALGNVEAEAAHIIPKSKNGSDDPRNGICLCRFHHWTLDRGVLSVSDDYRILISPRVNDFTDKPDSLRAVANGNLRLPNVRFASPDPNALEWHRANVFIKREGG